MPMHKRITGRPFLILQEAAQPISTPFPKHADCGFENVDIVFLQVGKGRNELFVILFSDAKNARAIPDN